MTLPTLNSTQRQDSIAEESKASSSDEQEDKRSDDSGGAGYNADYESSESSLSSKQLTALQQQEEELNNRTVASRKNDGSITSSSAKNTATSSGVDQRDEERLDNSATKKRSSQQTKPSHRDTSLDETNSQLQALLPQWNGIRITHPMDPRIDLSTVGFTVNSGGNNTVHMAPAALGTMSPSSSMADPNNHHCVNHYLHLMEVRSCDVCL